MIYTIVSLDDVFYQKPNNYGAVNLIRSTNPYDYIRSGFYLDNASMYGGKEYVNYKSNIASHRSGNYLGVSDK